MWKSYWVLLVDVMGFRERVRDRARRDDLVTSYSSVADDVLANAYNVLFTAFIQHRLVVPTSPYVEAARLAPDRWRARYKVFSDSLVFFFDPVGTDLHSPVDGTYLPIFAGLLSRSLWKKALPHRGAIAFGECHLDRDREIFLGEPIVDAHEWEQRQDWMGISIHPGSLAAAEKQFPHAPFRLGDVPLKRRPDAVDGAPQTERTGFLNIYDDSLFEARSPGYEDAALRGFLSAFEELPVDANRPRDLYRKTAGFFLKHATDEAAKQDLKLLTNDAS